MSAPQVSYTLRVQGSPVEPAALDAIQSVEVEHHAELADVARLKLTTAVAGKDKTWTIIDDPICTRLANVQIGVRIGGGAATPLLDGYVIDVRAALGTEPGRSTVEVVAMDATVLMDLEEKVRAWPDQADSAIADAIFGEYGFDTDVQSTEPVRQESDVTSMQRGSDIRFLRKLAERNGYECFLDVGESGRTTGHFHPPRLDQSSQTVLSVNLGTETTLDQFKVRYDMLSATTATASGIDAHDASDQPVQAPTGSQKPLGGASTVPADRPRTKLLTGNGLSRGGELQTLAQAVVDRSSYAITADGVVNAAVIGQVLRAKQPVLVRGAGMQFSGQYYVHRVLHRFVNNGYQQHATLKRNAAGLTHRESFQDDNSAAPQPAVRV
ncbi:MAG TPA: contractile injection system protein, VgrG/Pvc8 family [Solirubrobacteraceae bacterium]|jgi:phage protein D